MNLTRFFKMAIPVICISVFSCSVTRQKEQQNTYRISEILIPGCDPGTPTAGFIAGNKLQHREIFVRLNEDEIQNYCTELQNRGVIINLVEKEE